MPRKPTRLQQDAFALHEEISKSAEMYWEGDEDGDTPPSHYMLNEALYFKLMRWLQSAAGRAYPKKRKPSHPRNVRRGRI
jgi:hypothetical protein